MCYEISLREALEHTRKVFAEMDGCLPEDVPQFHPDDPAYDKQIDLFGELEDEMSIVSI